MNVLTMGITIGRLAWASIYSFDFELSDDYSLGATTTYFQAVAFAIILAIRLRLEQHVRDFNITF